MLADYYANILNFWKANRLCVVTHKVKIAGISFCCPAFRASLLPSTMLRRLVHLERARAQSKHGGRRGGRAGGRAFERNTLMFSLFQRLW